MKRYTMFVALLAFASTLAWSAEDGAAIFKAKCAMCHGPSGTPSAGMAKAMGIKPVSDPSIKGLSAADMFNVVKNGKGKMKPVAGLTDQQIKDAVAFYRGLK